MPVGQFFIALQVMYLLSTTLYNQYVSKIIALIKNIICFYTYSYFTFYQYNDIIMLYENWHYKKRSGVKL